MEHNEILPGHSYEEKLRILEKLRLSSRSVPDTLKIVEWIEEVRKQHRDAETSKTQQNSCTARLRKLDLLIMQKRFSEARICFEEFHGIFYQLNEGDTKQLTEAWNKIVQGEQEKPQPGAATSPEILTVGQILGTSKESPKITADTELDNTGNNLSLQERKEPATVEQHNPLRSSGECQKSAADFLVTQEENRSLKAQNKELQEKFAALEKDRLTILLTSEHAKHNQKLAAYSLAHVYLENPDYLLSVVQKLISSLVEQKRLTHRFNTSLVSNIAETILENYDACFAPYSQLFPQTGETT